jgi:hypothetical protein
MSPQCDLPLMHNVCLIRTSKILFLSVLCRLIPPFLHLLVRPPLFPSLNSSLLPSDLTILYNHLCEGRPPTFTSIHRHRHPCSKLHWLRPSCLSPRLHVAGFTRSCSPHDRCCTCSKLNPKLVRIQLVSRQCEYLTRSRSSGLHHLIRVLHHSRQSDG